MNIATLFQGEPWMTPEELDLNRTFVQATADSLKANGIPEHPLIALRINDVVVTWLLTRRLETTLTPAPGEPVPCPTTAQAGAIGKSRERLRRAMKDLEDCCPPVDASTGSGLVATAHGSDKNPEKPQEESETVDRSAGARPGQVDSSTRACADGTPQPNPSTAEGHPARGTNAIRSESSNVDAAPLPPETSPVLPTPRDRTPGPGPKQAKKHRMKRGIPQRPRPS